MPGQPDKSPLFKKIVNGENAAARRAAAAQRGRRRLAQAVDRGRRARCRRRAANAPLITEAAVFDSILADLEKLDKRSRRFQRYFSLASLANAGHGER